MINNPVRIGLIGLGTVGTGVAKLLLEDSEAIYQRTGIRLELARIVDKDIVSKRKINIPSGLLTSDINQIIDDPSILIAIELVGGTTFAKQVQEKLLQVDMPFVCPVLFLVFQHLFRRIHSCRTIFCA